MLARNLELELKKMLINVIFITKINSYTKNATIFYLANSLPHHGCYTTDLNIQ